MVSPAGDLLHNGVRVVPQLLDRINMGGHKYEKVFVAHLQTCPDVIAAPGRTPVACCICADAIEADGAGDTEEPAVLNCLFGDVDPDRVEAAICS